MNEKEQELSIAFSGGVDSTIAAINFLETGSKVHLLTFSHCFLLNVERSGIMASRLGKVFGFDRVSHQILDADHLLKNFVLKHFLSDIPRFNGYFVCMGCKLCVHSEAIIYNLRNNIRTCADGNVPGATFDQTPEMMELIKGFYSEYGLEYIPFTVKEKSLSNIFWENEGRVEQKERLLKHGLISRAELSKWKKYKFQPFCLNGQINAMINERLLRPTVVNKRFYKPNLENAACYFKNKKRFFSNYIENRISQP